MKGGPKLSLRPFLHRALHLFIYKIRCVWQGLPTEKIRLH